MKLNNEYLEKIKDNTYYDKTGKEILVGDLLKVYHFKSKNRTQYMYHVVVMEDTNFGFPVMSVRSYYEDKPHCRIYVLADKESKIFKLAKIIGTRDYQTIRKRIKLKR
jgi:hypothetical protein